MKRKLIACYTLFFALFQMFGVFSTDALAETTVDSTVMYAFDPFENGCNLYIVERGAQIERAQYGGSMALHFCAPEKANSSAYADLGISMLAEVNAYVVDVMLTPVSLDGGAYIGLFDGKDQSGNWRKGAVVCSNGSIVMNGAELYHCSAGETIRYCAAYNVNAGTCDVYINGTVVKRGIEVGNLKVNTLRIDIANENGISDNGRADFFIDDLKVYSGNAPADHINAVESDCSTFTENEHVVRSILEDCAVFSVSGKYYYKNGSRNEYAYENLIPYAEAEKVFVSGDFVRTFINADKDDSFLSGLNGSKEVNGLIYITAQSAAELAGMEYMYDKRGFFIFSQTEFLYKDSADFTEVFEPVDLIYRYICFENPKSDDIKRDFFKKTQLDQHPRLIYNQQDIDYILSQTDRKWVVSVNNALSFADNCLACDKEFSGDCSDANKQAQAVKFQTVIERLAIGYMLTGDTKYAQKATDYMQTMCEWQTLGLATANLTTGHWAMGMAIGYDTFYDWLNKNEENQKIACQIKDAVARLAFYDTEKAYRGGGGAIWINLSDNFQGVIGGGMTALALAFLDDKELGNQATWILKNLIGSLEVAVSLFYPDGGYFEGMGYSEYMLGNLTCALEALFKCCGTDYGLTGARGFSDAIDFFVYMQTKDNMFNFHDCGVGYTTTTVPYWFGWRCAKTEAMEMMLYQNELRGSQTNLSGMFFVSKARELHGVSDITDLETDRYFYQTETGSFRDSFDTAEPTFVGFHGGRTNITHDMLDLGEFVFEAQGVMWAVDLGGDSYDLEGYFSQNGYRYYRKRPEGKNCLVINPSENSYGQCLDVESELILYQTTNRGAMAAYDLTEAYGEQVKSYKRGYYFGDERKTLLIQDEISLKSDSEIYWFMHTQADIEISPDGKSAVLSQDGKTLRAEVCCNQDYTLSYMDAVPLEGKSPVIEGQNQNSGYRKLVVCCPQAKGEITIRVKLVVQSNFFDAAPISSDSIADWTLPTGEKEIKLAISDASATYANTLTAHIQFPYGTDSADLYLDDEYQCPLSVICGREYFMPEVDISSLNSGTHKATIRSVGSDGSVHTADTFFPFEKYEQHIMYQNSLDNYSGEVLSCGNGWNLMTTGAAYKTSDLANNCFRAVSDGSSALALTYIIDSDYAVVNDGVFVMECDVSFSSLSGHFEFECRNLSDSGWYMHNVKLFNEGRMSDGNKYSENNWYKLKLIVDTASQRCQVFVNGAALTDNLYMSSANAMAICKMQYVTDETGAAILYRNLKINKYSADNFAQYSICCENNEICAFGTVNDITQHADGVIVLAAYSGDKLVNIGIMPFADCAQDNSFNIKLQVLGDETHIKLFFWDLCKNIKPLSGNKYSIVK